MIKPRKQPMRKCVGCQQMRHKKELIRVVRTPEGRFTLDATGKVSGRGAYVCPDGLCLERAFKQRGLERSFRSKMPAEVFERLRQTLGPVAPNQSGPSAPPEQPEAF